VPDSYGKRARRDANAKKQAAREARRDERAQRNRDREAGLIEKGVPIGPAEQAEFLPTPRNGTDGQGDRRHRVGALLGLSGHC
jgi:hypothetical protein